MSEGIHKILSKRKKDGTKVDASKSRISKSKSSIKSLISRSTSSKSSSASTLTSTSKSQFKTPSLLRSTSTLQNASSKTKDKRPRSRGPRRLSRLETIPLELLTMIFLESMEISLPQASKILAERLSSSYIVDQYILRAQSLKDAQISRLLRCRLFKWELVRFRPQLSDQLFATGKFRSSKGPITRYRTNIVIPPQILRGPWTTDKIELLKWFMNNAPPYFPDPGMAAKHAARDGFWTAIDEANPAAVILLVAAMSASGPPETNESLFYNKEMNISSTFISSVKIAENTSSVVRVSRMPVFGGNPFGLHGPQALLRHAILDSTPETFSRAIIVAIVHFDSTTVSGRKLNLLDRALWAWADRDMEQSTNSKGDSNGEWLLELLKLADKVQTSEWFVLAFCKTARRVTYDKYGLTETKTAWLFSRFLWEWMAVFDRVPQ